jgi:hypothetical protein
VTSDNTKKTKSAKASAAASEADAAVTAAPAAAPMPAAPPPAMPTPVSLDAAIGRLRAAAYAAVALSIVGVALAATVPIWSPQVYGNASSARFLALGVAQLRPVLETDAPFSVELATLKKIAVGDNEITRALETIASDSGRGVPTQAQLQVRFSHMATEVLLSDVVDVNRGWFDRVMLNVASTMDLHVHLQKVKDKQTASKDILFQAHTALIAGDLARAADLLGTLSGRSAELAASWVKAARARIAANQVLKFLDTVATARMSSGYLQTSATF